MFEITIRKAIDCFHKITGNTLSSDTVEDLLSDENISHNSTGLRNFIMKNLSDDASIEDHITVEFYIDAVEERLLQLN